MYVYIGSYVYIYILTSYISQKFTLNDINDCVKYYATL